MGTARAPFKSRTLEKSLSPLAPSTSTSRWAQVDSQPSDGAFQQLPSLSSPFFMMIYELLYWILYSIRESHLTYVRFSYYFFVMKVPRATKLCRIVQKACRHTLIAKTPFRLSVPKVRFLLATLTYIYTLSNVYLNKIVSLVLSQTPSVSHQAWIVSLPFQQEAVTGHPARRKADY